MRVEIWSDVVCPWCYIGKRRFETALAGFAHRDEVEVRWRSFELQPDSPAEVPGRHVDHLAAKFGSGTTEAQRMLDRVATLARAEGLEYDFDAVRTGNTFDAHRLLHLAAELGRQEPAKERLMRAYFTEGAAIGDRDTLVTLAGEVGIDTELATATLASDRYAEDVRADEQQARALGVNAVPFFVIDRRYGVAGAESPDNLRGVLERSWSETAGGAGGEPAR